jgi:hypothetical protein
MFSQDVPLQNVNQAMVKELFLMSKLSKFSIAALTLLLLGNLFIVGAKTSFAQGGGTAIAPSQSEDGKPACWVAVGNKVYFVEKDTSTILKVKASGAL